MKFPRLIEDLDLILLEMYEIKSVVHKFVYENKIFQNE